MGGYDYAGNDPVTAATPPAGWSSNGRVNCPHQKMHADAAPARRRLRQPSSSLSRRNKPNISSRNRSDHGFSSPDLSAHRMQSRQASHSRRPGPCQLRHSKKASGWKHKTQDRLPVRVAEAQYCNSGSDLFRWAWQSRQRAQSQRKLATVPGQCRLSGGSGARIRVVGSRPPPALVHADAAPQFPVFE